ncbi:MAG: LysR family transcriptional regulator [Qingshengfaniella sp.]
MDGWDEIRTAYHVARLGTVSGAAEALGVHHATVIRHIDALEARLGTKLFQRHARGYTATEAGQDLQQVAQTTSEQFTHLVGRLKGLGETVAGELTVTSLGPLSGLLVPGIARFQLLHPELMVRFLTDDRLFRLEYGEAHVAIRAGTAPDQPDNVVQKLARVHAAIYASETYIKQRGMPDVDGDLSGHVFVGHDLENTPAPFYRWLDARVGRASVTFRTADARATLAAVENGAGLGFVSLWEAVRTPGLVQVAPPRDEWSSQLWLVTHVDLHRTAKVQALSTHLKAEAKSWGDV